MRVCLLCGMGLTHIFRFFGVPPEGEAFKEILHTDTYDIKSLHRTGYRKIDGWLIEVRDKKQSLTRRTRSEL